MTSLLVQLQVMALHRKMLMKSIMQNKIPKQIHSHRSQEGLDSPSTHRPAPSKQERESLQVDAGYPISDQGPGTVY